MERIESLILKLKQQHEQNAGKAALLGTVQLLQFELSKDRTGTMASLGTAKVSVVLPSAAGIVPPMLVKEHEEYAPKPVQEQPISTIKEPVLQTSKEEVKPAVQKTGQLDMSFDPMLEIPTLSQQTISREVNDSGLQSESLNDKLKTVKTELSERLKEAPVKDLRKAVGINDRFLFINELFRGDESTYERSIKTINSFNIYAEAEYWINRELKVKLGWSNDSATVQQFDHLVRRRFS